MIDMQKYYINEKAASKFKFKILVQKHNHSFIVGTYSCS